jgi:hypothetical protein
MIKANFEIQKNHEDSVIPAHALFHLPLDLLIHPISRIPAPCFSLCLSSLTIPYIFPVLLRKKEEIEKCA